jgi:hypothetical protein
MIGVSEYLVRYGLMGHVGRFPAAAEVDGSLERGAAVVIRTDRGLEMGEVLVRLAAGGSGETRGDETAPAPADSDHPCLLHEASPLDAEAARCAGEARDERYARCVQVLREGNWPIELVDVEPLLDRTTTVLHFVGPLDLDFARLRAHFRTLCELDVVFEPVGSAAVSGGPSRGGEPSSGCGDCAGGGCGSGRSTGGAGEPAAAGCGAASHGGCTSCAVSKWRDEFRTRVPS